MESHDVIDFSVQYMASPIHFSLSSINSLSLSQPAMITINNITTHSLSSVTKPNFSSPVLSPSSSQLFTKSNPPKNSSLSTRKRKNRVVYGSVTDDTDVFTVKTSNSKDQRSSSIGGSEKFESLVSSLLPSSSSSSSEPSEEEEKGGGGDDDDDYGKLISRAINATIVLAAGSIAVTRLLTIDHDYWQGWTFYEVLRYAPEHNWIAYEEALKTNPVLAKMVISGIVYSLGDWIAQCVEGKPLFEIDRTRVLRSGLVGFSLHGSLSHYYYQFCEVIFPFKDWWVVPAKIAFDQTLWAAVWNSIYFVVLALLRLESPANIYRELKATFWPMLTAGWKLWPFAHLITYGVIPLEQRLLWVDCVELIWVTILSTYSNEKSEARSEASLEANSHSSPENPPEE